MPIDEIDNLDSVLAELGVTDATDRLEGRSREVLGEISKRVPMRMVQKGATLDALRSRVGLPTTYEREATGRARAGRAAGADMGFLGGVEQGIDEAMLPAAGFAAKLVDGDNFALIDEAIQNINETHSAQSAGAQSGSAIAGQIAGQHAPMVPIMGAAAIGGVPAAVVEGLTYAPMMMGSAEDAINRGATTRQALAESIVHPLAMAGGMRIPQVRTMGQAGAGRAALAGRVNPAAPTAGRAALQAVAEAPVHSGSGLLMGAGTAAIREPGLAAIGATADAETQPGYDPSAGIGERLKGDAAMAIINPLMHASTAPMKSAGIRRQQDTDFANVVQEHGMRLADQIAADTASRRLPAPAEAPQAKVDEIDQRLKMSEDEGDLAPARVAGEKAMMQARAKLLADVDAQQAGEARNAEARNALAPDLREITGIAAERERIQREQYVRDVAKSAERDAAALDEQAAAAREEGDLQTEASAREREAQLEAEARANVERGGKLDAEKVAIAEDEGRLSDMEMALKSKPPVSEQVREARARIENEYLRAKSRDGDMQIDLEGVERPVDRSVLKANRGEIVQRVRQEADAIRAADKAEREQVRAVRRQIAERKAAHAEATSAMRAEGRAAKQEQLAERRSVPAEPASVRNRSQDATIPAPEPRSTSDRLKAILAARRDGRLTAEQARAAAARVRAETSQTPTITPKDPNALPSTHPGPASRPVPPAPGPAGPGGAGNLPVPGMRAPGAGAGLPAAGGAARPGPVGGGPAGTAGVATPASQHATRMAELDVQKREAEKDLADTKWKGSEIDRDRAGIDVEYAAMREDAKGGVEKAKLADATAEQKQEASKLADTAVTTAEKRVALAKAKLDLVTGKAADPTEVQAAKEDLAETQIELTKARTVKADADNLHRTVKRDIAEERNVALMAKQREHAERLLPDIERGARATLGKDVSGKITIDGDVEILDPAGNRKMLYRMNLNEREVAHTDLEGWWASAGSANIRAWLNGRSGTAAEKAAGKAALKMLGGEMPTDPAHVRRLLAPDAIVKFIRKAGVDAAYDLRSGEATLFNVSNMLSEHAFNNALHEGNHRGVHGIIRLALAGKGAEEHLETMVKATGIDPRKDGQMLPFLEEVQRRYSIFSKGAAQRASMAAQRANPSRMDRALAFIGKQIRRMFETLRLVRKQEPDARLSLDDVFGEIEAGKWRDVPPPRTEGGDAFATRVPDEVPPSLRERMDETRVGRAITRTGDKLASLGKDAVEAVVGTGSAIAKRAGKVADSMVSEASEIRRVDAIRERLKREDPEEYKRIMRKPPEAFASRVPARNVAELRKDVERAETPEEAERAAKVLAKADKSLGEIPESGRGIAEQARTATKAQAETYKMQEKALDAEIAEQGYAKRLAAAVQRGVERMGRLEADERDIATLDDILIQREMGRVLDTHDATGRFDYGKFNDLMLSHSASGEEAGRRLAFFRDRLETPAERRGAARKAMLTPAPRTMKELKKLDRRRKAAEARGDEAGARKAGKLFDEMQQRLIDSQTRRVERIKKATGLDLTDNATLDQLLGGKDAFATNLSHLEDMAHAADPKTNVLDWIISNQRAGMLSDVATTQPQQVVSNLASMLSGTMRESLRRPGAVLAAMRGDIVSQVFKNAIESRRLGKNAFVERHLNLEIGRGDIDQYRNPQDRLSKVMRLISFDIMAGIDGAAQRYNAQLEMSAIAYERARSAGLSRAEATKRATEELKSGLPDEDTAEAIWRSLPATFQELAIPRPGKESGLEKVVGGVSRLQTSIDEYLGEAIGKSVGWFRDKESGAHLPFPMTRILLPFVRTPLALANAAMRHSPAGLLHLRAAWKNLQAEKEIDGQVEWAREEVWRRSYESILLGTIGMHGLAPALGATGTNGQPDMDKTVEILGRRVGYSRIEPFATPLAMAANGIKAFKEGKPLWEIPLHEVSALLKLGSDLAWFRLVADAGVALADIEKESRRADGDVAGKVRDEIGMGLTKTALSLVPIAGARAIRGPLTSGDDLTKPEEGIVGYVKGEYGVDRTVRRDVWGAPLKRGPLDGELAAITPGPAAVGKALEGGAERVLQGGFGRSRLPRSTDVDAWLKARGARVPEWAPEGEDGKRLKGKDADVFIARAGPLLLESLGRVMKSRPNMAPAELEAVITAHKRFISGKVRRELAKKP